MLLFHILPTLGTVKLFNISQIDRWKMEYYYNLNFTKITDEREHLLLFIGLLYFFLCDLNVFSDWATENSST